MGHPRISVIPYSTTIHGSNTAGSRNIQNTNIKKDEVNTKTIPFFFLSRPNLRNNLFEFSQKIKNSSGITITDTEPYQDETTDEDADWGVTQQSYLRLEPNGCLLTVTKRHFDSEPYKDGEKEWSFWHIPREDLKAIVTSGRIPKFLKYAAEVLAEKETEFEQIADYAEKVNNAIKEEEN